MRRNTCGTPGSPPAWWNGIPAGFEIATTCSVSARTCGNRGGSGPSASVNSGRGPPGAAALLHPAPVPPRRSPETYPSRPRTVARPGLTDAPGGMACRGTWPKNGSG